MFVFTYFVQHPCIDRCFWCRWQACANIRQHDAGTSWLSLPVKLQQANSTTPVTGCQPHSRSATRCQDPSVVTCLEPVCCASIRFQYRFMCRHLLVYICFNPFHNRLVLRTLRACSMSPPVTTRIPLPRLSGARVVTRGDVSAWIVQHASIYKGCHVTYKF